MTKERKWWSVPRVPPAWWRSLSPSRQDSMAGPPRARSETRELPAAPSGSEPPPESASTTNTESEDNSAIPAAVEDKTTGGLSSISFSFFNEVERILSSASIGNNDTASCSDSKCEPTVEMASTESISGIQIDQSSSECKGTEDDTNTISLEVRQEKCDGSSSEKIQTEPFTENGEEETDPDTHSVETIKEVINNTEASRISDGGYEVLRIRSVIPYEISCVQDNFAVVTNEEENETKLYAQVSKTHAHADNQYDSPRGSRYTTTVASSVVSSEFLSREATSSPLGLPMLEQDWGSVEGGCGTEYVYYEVQTVKGKDEEDYEELEYCQHRAARKRGTLMRPRVVRVTSRIGRAWRAMRVWWGVERVRLGQVIQRQAHAQAVQALSGPEPATDADVESDQPETTTTTTVVVRRSRALTQRDGSRPTSRALTQREGSRPTSRAGLRRSRYYPEGQNGFEELRRYIKQGGDFCKDLSSILQERSEAETQYAKSLSKLSGKLLKASKDSVGSVHLAWQRAGAQMEAQSEAHRAFAAALSEEVVKPLRQVVESQHRIRKSVEAAVDKTGKSLSEWRSAEAKSKKQSFVSARENEKLQDAMLDVRLGRSGSGHLHHSQSQKNVSDKECAKLESKRRKAEEAVKKADVEYYTFCIRAERARLEWETAVIRGSHCFQALEEERLQQLKDLAGCYLQHLQEMGPKLVQSTERLTEPVESCDVARDIQTVVSIKGTGQPIPEQLLPDFYAEHITLAMNRDRRKQALVKLLQLIRQDLERERRGKQGVESLARALQQTPTFGAEDSQQNLTEKLHHMRSMLTYLEAARYKVQSALAELDGRARGSHPLASHIQVTRDRQGLQQSVLKVPPWVRKESLDQLAGDSPDWTDRGAGDGNSVQPDSDFDEFSSQGSEKDYQSSVMTYPVISECSETTTGSGTRCRALYEYAANLYDELNLRPGDVINIHDKQADGWWLGELNGVVGIFPATYVEEMK